MDSESRYFDATFLQRFDGRVDILLRAGADHYVCTGQTQSLRDRVADS